MSEEWGAFRNFGIALFIGALVGIEREKRKESGAGDSEKAGVRTFILVALAGGLSAHLSQTMQSGWIFASGLVGLGLLLATVHHAELSLGRAATGVTTEVAAVVVFLLGGAAVLGHVHVAVALAIVTSGVLALEKVLHDAVGRVDLDDFISGLKLLFASFIVLPLLPDAPIDPFGALNPYKLWLLVVLISALSLAGYIAVRRLGPRRGMAVTGLAGGLVSSTAVTLAFARRSRDEGVDHRTLAVGLLLAWVVMCVRVVVAVAVVNAHVALMLAPPLGIMGCVAGLCAAVASRGSPAQDGSSTPDLKVQNPFSLLSAARFAAIFAVSLLAVAVARQFLPEEALLLVAAAAGSTDVDAISLSMARMADAEISVRFATQAIVVAAIANTVVKAGIVAALGSRALAQRVFVATVAMTAGGVVALLLGSD